MLSGFGRGQKNITFNRLQEMTDWHNSLSFNRMAGNLLYNTDHSQKVGMNKKEK